MEPELPLVPLWLLVLVPVEPVPLVPVPVEPLPIVPVPVPLPVVPVPVVPEPELVPYVSVLPLAPVWEVVPWLQADSPTKATVAKAKTPRVNRF